MCGGRCWPFLMRDGFLDYVVYMYYCITKQAFRRLREPEDGSTYRVLIDLITVYYTKWISSPRERGALAWLVPVGLCAYVFARAQIRKNI